MAQMTARWPAVHALIPAAGQSVRFGGTTLKQYAGVGGTPVMALSIRAVRSHPAVGAVTVVLARDDGIYQDLLAPDHPDVGTTIGGATRAESVHRGLQHIRRQDPEARWVLIHDAARPCLATNDMENLFSAVFDSSSGEVRSPDGAILAVPVADTLKRALDPPVDLARHRQTRAGSSRAPHHRPSPEAPAGPVPIRATVDRKGLWAAQTPQLFPLQRLSDLVAEAIRNGARHTDESAVMEAAGHHPLLVPGSTHNIKITGARDLELAEAILTLRSVPADSAPTPTRSAGAP